MTQILLKPKKINNHNQIINHLQEIINNQQKINHLQEIIYEHQKNIIKQYDTIIELVNTNASAKVMNKFRFGKIYRIVSPSTDKVYVGSTIYSLATRLEGHQKDYDRYMSGLHNYISSYELIKLGDATIHLIENYPCLSKKELFDRETYYLQNTKNLVNTVIPGQERTQDQTYKQTPEYQVYLKNRELYRQTPQHKEYLEKLKLYKQTPAYKESWSKIIICSCGKNVKQRRINKHCKTKAHLQLMTQLNVNTTNLINA